MPLKYIGKCNIYHNEHHILYIGMGEIAKFISHILSLATDFWVSKTTFSWSDWTYFLQNGLPRWDQISTQLMFIHNCVVYGSIPWMVHCGVLVHSDQLYVSQLKVRDPELHESKHKRHFHSKHEKAAITINMVRNSERRKVACWKVDSRTSYLASLMTECQS